MDGYTKVTIAGKEVGLRFAYTTVRDFGLEGNKPGAHFFTETTKELTGDGLAKLLQLAHRDDCFVRETEPKLKFVDFIEFVQDKEKSDPDELVRLISVYANSTIGRSVTKAVEEIPQENVEKKSEQAEQTDLTLMP